MRKFISKALMAVVLDKKARSRLEGQTEQPSQADGGVLSPKASIAAKVGEDEAWVDERQSRQAGEAAQAEELAAKILEATATLDRINQSAELDSLLGKAEKRLTKRSEANRRAAAATNALMAEEPSIGPPGGNGAKKSRDEIIAEARAVMRAKQGLLDHLSEEDRVRLYLLGRKALGLPDNSG